MPLYYLYKKKPHLNWNKWRVYDHEAGEFGSYDFVTHATCLKRAAEIIGIQGFRERMPGQDDGAKAWLFLEGDDNGLYRACSNERELRS